MIDLLPKVAIIAPNIVTIVYYSRKKNDKITQHNKTIIISVAACTYINGFDYKFECEFLSSSSCYSIYHENANSKFDISNSW